MRAAARLPAQGSKQHSHPMQGQRRWPKGGERILGWAQPRGQILHILVQAGGGNEAIAVLAAEQEFDPVPGPFGLQSSPFLILPPAQPRGMQSRMALASATARGCFAGTPSKGRGTAETPPAPSPAPRAGGAQPAAAGG